MKHIFILFNLIGILSLFSCATIVRGGKSEISITSNVPANLEIVEINNGRTVYSGKTPTIVSLQKGSGFFKKAIYEIEANADGYTPIKVTLAADKIYVGGYIVGNLFLPISPLVGLVLVDPLTGAMWKWSPPYISEGQGEVTGKNIRGRKNGKLNIVFQETAPVEIKQEKD